MPTTPAKLAELIGHNIAARRHAAGWTQAQLARRLTLNRVTVARIETGANLPSIPLLFRLADLFHCSADDFRRAGPDDWTA